jgi:hypothetical protein
MFEAGHVGSDDGVRLVCGIGQFRNRDVEQSLEARWLEMNGEVVDTSTDRKAGPSARLGTTTVTRGEASQ